MTVHAAIIENNVVTRIVVADTLDLANQLTGVTCIDVTDGAGQVGYTYDPATGQFTPPAPVIPA